MKVDCIMVTNNNVNPVDQICVNVSDTTVEPPEDNNYDVNYDDLTDEQKIQFDDTVAMIKTYIPA